jgi:hypothetical protein
LINNNVKHANEKRQDCFCVNYKEEKRYFIWRIFANTNKRYERQA